MLEQTHGGWRCVGKEYWTEVGWDIYVRWGMEQEMHKGGAIEGDNSWDGQWDINREREWGVGWRVGWGRLWEWGVKADDGFMKRVLLWVMSEAIKSRIGLRRGRGEPTVYPVQ